MLGANQFQTNFTVGLQRNGLLEKVMLCIMTTLTCCVFLFINVTMLFTLRRKSVFCETSRYILLFNLLLADTVNLLQGQLLYILAVCRIMLTYPVCCAVVMLANLAKTISPVTLVVMCLERYVAVCYPLRHAAIVTIRNTGITIIVIWVFSSLYILINVLLILIFSFEVLQSLQMTDFCGKESLFFDTMSDLYEKFLSSSLFVLAGVAVCFSYIGVLIAARSASTDKASARKARNTLLLHLVQLGLSLSSTVHNPLLFSIFKHTNRITFTRIQVAIYVFIILLPRCLSALIYGLRDQTIRPVLIYNLCCLWRLSLSVSAFPTKANISFKLRDVTF